MICKVDRKKKLVFSERAGIKWVKAIGKFLLLTLANLTSIIVFFLLGAILMDKVLNVKQQEQFFIGLIIIFVFAVLTTRFLSYKIIKKTGGKDEKKYKCEHKGRCVD